MELLFKDLKWVELSQDHVRALIVGVLNLWHNSVRESHRILSIGSNTC
jgi:hypothetical protein